MARRVWLMRHGHSLWQEGAELLGGRDPGGLTDAGLSERGWVQARAALEAVTAIAPDLIVTSPYTRAIQTALAVCERTPIPVHVEPLARERLGDSCDIGRTPLALTADFPSLDFAHLEERWWYDGPPDARGIPVEPRWLLAERIAAFAEWLRARDEESMFVVSHSGVLRRMTGRAIDNCEVVEWGGELTVFPEDSR